MSGRDFEGRFFDKDHSPSLLTLVGRGAAPSIVDYCFVGSAFPPPEELVNDFCQWLPYLIGHYPSENCAMRKKFSEQLGVPFEHIVPANGSSELIKLVAGLPFERMTIPVPTFSEYEHAIKSSGRQINYYQLDKEMEFRLDETDFIHSVIESASDAALIVNPNNPTGTLVEEETLRAIVHACHFLRLLILDVSFIDYAYEEPPLLLSQLSAHENLAVMKSLGKAYGIPGLRLGFIASANEEFINRIAQSIAEWNVNSFAEFFIDRLPEYEHYYRAKRKELMRYREEFIGHLRRINGIRIFDSRANFIFAEILQDFDSVFLEQELLTRGFYIRACRNKRGVTQKFFRVAVKDPGHNRKLAYAIGEILAQK